MLPETLTEAAYLHRLAIVSRLRNGTYSSNARSIPYREIYRDTIGVIETPAEHFQHAAEDEKKRKKNSP